MFSRREFLQMAATTAAVFGSTTNWARAAARQSMSQSDLLKFDSTHHSQSKDTEINILDLHLTHAIRILNNYLTGDQYPRYSDRQEINDSLRGIRDRVEDISEVVNKWPW